MGRHEADKPEVSTLWFHCLCPAHLCPSVFLANEAYYVCVPQSVCSFRILATKSGGDPCSMPCCSVPQNGVPVCTPVTLSQEC